MPLPITVTTTQYLVNPGSLLIGHMCPIMMINSKTFIRSVRRYARRHGLHFHFDARKGKGSHGRLYLGNRFTTLKHGTISTGLARKMIRDLGINPEDFLNAI
jgi:mRNA interferase HicA